MRSLGIAMLALGLLVTPAAAAQVSVEGIDNPQTWARDWLDRFEEEGTAVMAEMMMAYGRDAVAARNAVSGLSPVIDGHTMLDGHFMSDTRYGPGMRQIVLATYWDSGTPVFVRFLFMRVGEDWHAIQFDTNTQLSQLNVYTGPGEAVRVPRG